MLEFFRKYQRYFFIFVTVVIVVTFSLFGSYKSSFGSGDDQKEIVVGSAIDGSELKYFEIKKLASLLGAETGKTSVVRNEFLKTGIAADLAQAFAEPLKGDWQMRLDRAKHCRFYAHPAAPLLNAREIWQQLAPQALEELHVLQQMPEPGSEFFASWMRLFELQEQCPSDLVKRILLYQQNQYQISPDPHLFNEDCSLLGFKEAGEWLGPQMSDLIAQFILNGAIMAEEKGYCATRVEAAADLSRRFSSKNQSLNQTLHAIGVSQNDAIRLWQRVVVYLRYFQSVGNAPVLDDLSYRDFTEFANETALIDVYTLPKELQLQSIDDFLAFEIYKRLACTPCDGISSPSSLQSVAEVERKAPELVYTKYHLKCAQIDVRTVQSRLSMHEVWSWQMEPMHWAELKKVFPEIAESAEISPFQALEKLDPMRRSAVDDWSRQQIVNAHPDWVEQELSSAAAKDLDLYVFANGDIDGLAIDRTADFHNLLERSVVGDAAAIAALQSYREKDQIRRISGVERNGDRSVISLTDAKKMDRLHIETFLEEEYALLKDQFPTLFRDENGEFKLLSDVKETLVKQVFAPLFRELDREIGKTELSSVSYYIQHRFEPWMRQMLARLKAGEDLSTQGLWPIEHSERTIHRSSDENWIMKQSFILTSQEWSDVYTPPDGEIVFFFLKERVRVPVSVLDPIQQGKQVLAADVKHLLAQDLLRVALDKKSIVLPLKVVEPSDEEQ